LEELLRTHQRLVVTVIKRQWLGEVAYADLVQEGQIALWQAIEGYEPERGNAFSTYAWVVIERHIWQVVARGNRKEGGVRQAERAEPLTLAEEGLARRECGEAVAAVVKQLPARLGQVVVAAYGLDGQPARSLAAIGREQGVSRERVRQLHNEALRQLRRPDRSEGLRLWWGQASRVSYQHMQQQNRHCLRQRRGRG
jgi:RNA polymerase sigma factor (sigma-70 family)